ncbi:hypothetical protein RWE15_03255 [Virgibacillus halophilus]|uniref:Tumour necrosis factor receptor superfamily member 19 n=1 Tax=Tigheibacillus halophilus TaxID=361280 RepID=A0ABU5C2U6_9BACI|nr:hypothetical protein [Virgibacillus halophilus]
MPFIASVVLLLVGIIVTMMIDPSKELDESDPPDDVPVESMDTTAVK